MANVKLTDTVDVSMTRITLERLRKWATINIGSFLADSMEIERTVIPGIEGMVYNMKAEVLASKLADDKYAAHFYWKEPSTWFQHWKQDHAPKWLTERYPVEYTNKKATKTVHFKRYETYPQANITVPKDQRTIEMLGYERPLLDIVEEY